VAQAKDTSRQRQKIREVTAKAKEAKFGSLGPVSFGCAHAPSGRAKYVGTAFALIDVTTKR
jgi:hypothetical protein